MDKKFIAELNKKTSLPKEQNIRYHSFISCEIFQIEDYDKLINGLDGLFGNYYKNKHVTKSRDYKGFIEKAISRLRNYSVLHVGKVFPTSAKGKVWSEGPFFDLPKNIHFINVQLLNLFPSMIFLIFYIALSPTFSNDITSILRKDYPEERREAVDEKGKKYHIYYSPKDLKEEAINKELFKIKHGFENFIKNYCKGLFLSQPVDSGLLELSLPYINNIYFGDIPVHTELKLENWLEKYKYLLECLNIWSDFRFLYSGGQFLFSEPFRDSPNYFNFVMISSEKLLDDRRYSGPDEELGMLIQLMRGIEFFSILKYLYFNFDVLKDYREGIKDINYVKTEYHKVKDVINYKRKINFTTFKAERLKMEFRRYLDDKSWNINLMDFNNLKDKKRKLFGSMVEYIQKLLESIFNEFMFLNKKIDNLYDFTHILINSRLSKYVAILTVILSSFTIGMFFLMVIQIAFQ